MDFLRSVIPRRARIWLEYSLGCVVHDSARLIHFQQLVRFVVLCVVGKCTVSGVVEHLHSLFVVDGSGPVVTTLGAVVRQVGDGRCGDLKFESLLAVVQCRVNLSTVFHDNVEGPARSTKINGVGFLVGREDIALA